MSESTKPESISLNTNLNNTHSTEQSLYPANLASLEPIRSAVSDKVGKMLLLKHLEENLELYDQYKLSDEDNYFQKIDTLQKSRHRTTLGVFVPLFISMGYLKLTGSHPFHLNSYISNFKQLALLTAGTWLIWKFYYNTSSFLAYKHFADDESIVDAKSLLHSQAVRLTNELKYPESDLL
jgi:hypothetical protein